MTILESFFKGRQNKEINENKKEIATDNIETVNKKNKNEFINVLQKQVVCNKKVNAVETVIRPGDGLGMNTKISG